MTEVRRQQIQWNSGIEYLERDIEGDWIEFGHRLVEVVRMCGGRYLLYENGEVTGLVDESWRAIAFLISGQLYM